jgi:hypothetical protein
MAAARFDVREARRMSLKNEWLIVVDMQRAFADSPSPWAAPGFYAALAQVERLLPTYRGRTILTRYVPPKVLAGAWIPYFAMFPSLLRPEDDPLWDLKLPAHGGALVERRPDRRLRGRDRVLRAEHHPRRSRSRPLRPSRLRRLRRGLASRRR